MYHIIYIMTVPYVSQHRQFNCTNATDCMAKSVHSNTIVKSKHKSFSVLA